MRSRDGREDRGLDVGGGHCRGANRRCVRIGGATAGDREVDGFLIAVVESERDRLGRRRATVLDREEDRLRPAAPVATPLHVQGRITPRVEVGRAAQRVARARTGRAILPRVVDDEDSDVECALETAKVGEDGGHLAGRVFVDALNSHERIEDEKTRPHGRDGVFEPRLVRAEVEPDRLRGDRLDRESLERHFMMSRDPFEPAPDDRRRILGGIEEHRARALHAEAPEARSPRGDRDRDLEGEPTLRRFRSPTEDPDAALHPEAVDEPDGSLLLIGGEMTRTDEGKEVEAAIGVGVGVGVGTEVHRHVTRPPPARRGSFP